MRTAEEIKKDLDEAQGNFNAKSSFIRMLEGNTPKDYLQELGEELKPIKARLQQLTAEYAECLSHQ